jgi:hypothetical protein
VKKEYLLITVSLLISLFIYLFFRTERTVVNELFRHVTTPVQYAELKNWITTNLPLNNHIIYSLPEGLWVFCITLTSKHLFIKAGRYQLDCIFIPLIFSIGLEFFQLFHFVKGRFDIWDIAVSVLCWMVANYLVKYRPVKQDVFEFVTVRSVLCVWSYSIVYLAHVVS